MRKPTVLIVAGALAITVSSIAATGALASAGSDVKRSGVCGTHPWSLELSPDHGRIEAYYELHNVKVGSTWHVVMRDNGVRFYAGTRTAGSDRYIEVDRYTKDRAGTDRITVKATKSNGRVCKASASI